MSIKIEKREEFVDGKSSGITYFIKKVFDKSIFPYYSSLGSSMYITEQELQELKQRINEIK
jgi:hypothetical protein